MPVVQPVIISESHSLIVDYVSEPIRVIGAETWSIQYTFTGTPTGVFYIEWTNDLTLPYWANLVGQEVTVNGTNGTDGATSAGGRVGYEYLRVRWEVIAPSPSGVVSINARVIGSIHE